MLGKVWNDRRQQGQIDCMDKGAGSMTEICHQMFKYHGTMSVSVRSIFAESPGFRKAGPGA